jgi:hypothetical protein
MILAMKLRGAMVAVVLRGVVLVNLFDIALAVKLLSRASVGSLAKLVLWLGVIIWE